MGPPPTPDEFLESLSGPIPDCPPCPDDPCVVLAAVDFDTDGTVTAVDNCSCRRMVVSLAGLWWRCAAAMMSVNEVSVTSKSPYVPGKKNVKIAVKGANLPTDATIDLGEGITVKAVTGGGASLGLTVDIADDAPPGDRTLTITTADGSTVTWPKALTVTAS